MRLLLCSRGSGHEALKAALQTVNLPAAKQDAHGHLAGEWSQGWVQVQVLLGLSITFPFVSSTGYLPALCMKAEGTRSASHVQLLLVSLGVFAEGVVGTGCELGVQCKWARVIARGQVGVSVGVFAPWIEALLGGFLAGALLGAGGKESARCQAMARRGK